MLIYYMATTDFDSTTKQQQTKFKGKQVNLGTAWREPILRLESHSIGKNNKWTFLQAPRDFNHMGVFGLNRLPEAIPLIHPVTNPIICRGRF